MKILGLRRGVANKRYTCDAYDILYREIKNNGPIDFNMIHKKRYEDMGLKKGMIDPGDEYYRITVQNPNGGSFMYRMHSWMYWICSDLDLLPFNVKQR